MPVCPGMRVLRWWWRVTKKKKALEQFYSNSVSRFWLFKKIYFFHQSQWLYNYALRPQKISTHTIILHWEKFYSYANKEETFASVDGSGNYSHLLLVRPTCFICCMVQIHYGGHPSVGQRKLLRADVGLEGMDGKQLDCVLRSSFWCLACRWWPGSLQHPWVHEPSLP